MRSSRRGTRNRGIRNRRKNTHKHPKKQRGGAEPVRRLIIQMAKDEGLGNQLFILGIGLRAQKLTKLPLYIILNYSKYHSENTYKTLYERPEKNIFILETDTPDSVMEQAKPILDNKSNKIPTKVEDSHFTWNPDDSGDVKVPADLYQNYGTVQSTISDVKSLLLENEFENETKKSVYDPVRSETDSAHSAFMHIRLGDYIKGGSAQKVEFYMDALKELEKNPEIKVIHVICTDEKYYKENESKLKGATTKELRLYNNPNELAALYKMILCTAGAILSASTFSAWGAMLGADMNDKSTIVYPKQWIKHMDWGDNPIGFPQRWIPIDSNAMDGEHGFDWRKEVGTKKGGRRTLRKMRQRGGQPTTPLVSGAVFKSECKYNLDDRYPIIPLDENLVEGDRVFLKVQDLQTKFLNSPPNKKVTLIFHNSDETFDDVAMNSVRPFVTEVYAVNCSAKGVKQIPLGFRDDRETAHKVIFDVLNDSSKSSEKSTLCLVNFNIETNGGERTEARDHFKGKSWANVSENYMNLNKERTKQYSDPNMQKMREDYYAQLKITKFVICPPGTGKDTHRVYEALFFGAVPVIRTSFLDPMYTKLGGCWIVKDWAEVTEEACNEQWATVSRPKIDFGVKQWL